MNRLFYTYCGSLLLLSTLLVSAASSSIKIEVRRTYDSPIVIDIKRLEGLNEEGKHVTSNYAVTRVYEGKGMGELGELYERKGKTLTDQEFDRVFNQLEQLNLWEIFRTYPTDRLVLHGPVWTIEATRGGVSARFSFYAPTAFPEAAPLAEFLRMVIDVADSPVDFSELQ
jgi:hypothetical protein